LISKKLRTGCTKKESRKSAFNACPLWLRIIAGVIIVYGAIMSVSFLVSSFYNVYTHHWADTKENIELFKTRFFIGLSALWVSIYTFEFAVLFCYRKLWNERLCGNTADPGLESITVGHNNVQAL
jgi:hypothetical protein